MSAVARREIEQSSETRGCECEHDKETDGWAEDYADITTKDA